MSVTVAFLVGCWIGAPVGWLVCVWARDRTTAMCHQALVEPRRVHPVRRRPGPYDHAREDPS